MRDLRKEPTARDLRHLITIQTMTDSVATGSGAVTEVATTFAKVYAEVTPLAGSEDYVAQGISASVVYRFRIRYLKGVTPKMQVSYDDRTFTIASVRNVDSLNRWMTLECTEDV